MATDNEKIAATLLLLKLQLEEQFKPKLNSFFSQIAREIPIVWAATQTLPSLESYQPELVAMLRTYYRKVAATFQDELINRISNNKLRETVISDAKISHNIVKYIKRHSEHQAKIILNTTKSDLQDAVARSIMNVAINGKLTTDYQLGKIIQKTFENEVDARKETIAITETQIASERMRFIETQGVVQLASELELPHVFQKDWSAILDNKTRHAHVLADGQKKNINAPFDVGGELMMIPGDTELGASLENIINCRCSSIVTFDGDTIGTE